MSRRNTTLLATCAVLAAFAFNTGAARASERICNEALGAERIDGDLVVSSGGACSLDGTRVDGNVKVRPGASLAARGARIDGDVQAEKHRNVYLSGGSVDGNIQLKQGGSARIVKVSVDGDIQLFDNRGTLRVNDNRVAGNLQCKANQPVPKGVGNRVGGHREDQCARM